MTDESKTAKWFRYLRHAFAVVIFAFAIWHWREFPVWGLAVLIGVLGALMLFTVGFYHWMDRGRNPYTFRSTGYVPRKPIFEISDSEITYSRRQSEPDSIRWDNVTAVEVIREIDWDMMLINLYWRVVASDGHYIRIWEEDSEYRDRLLQAFGKYLPEFSPKEAQNCFESKQEGRWICFERTVQQP